MSGHEPTPFSVQTDVRDARTVVVVRGELDLATASQVEDAVLPVVAGGGRVLLDLRPLEFMDSSGVRVLVAAHAAAEEHGGELSLVRPPVGGPIERLLAISGLDTVLHLVDEA